MRPLPSMKWLGFSALNGMLVLGLAGRLVMAALAAALGHPTNLSAVGVIGVVVLSGVLGALGGFFVHLLTLWGLQRGRGALASLLLFLVSMLLLKSPATVARTIDADPQGSMMCVLPATAAGSELLPIRLLTLGLAVFLFLIYGLLLDPILRSRVVQPPPAD